MRILLIALGLATGLSGCGGDDRELPANDNTPEYAFEIVKPVDQDIHRPWSIAFVSETEWLVTQRQGHLRVIRNSVLDPDPVAGAPRPIAPMEGGMLDVVLHPDFDDNRLVYLA